MSLATRCPACSTVFRVVQDQLKVSEGWVRCGRCHNVFNALEGLFDLERDAPPDDRGDADVVRPVAMTPEGPAPAPEALSAREGDPSLIEKIDAQLSGSREPGHDSTPATRISERDRLDFPDAQFDPDMLVEDTVDLQIPLAGPAPSTANASDAAPPAAAPEFVRRAQREARWQSPRARAAQASVSLGLLLALSVQGVHHFRDQVAMQWPASRAALSAWCGAVSCTIEAPHRLEDLVVESTALTRAAVPGGFGLSVMLRNRGAMTVALPSVDLSLTDAGGQLVARRMLSPADFGHVSGSVQPGSESALKLLMAVGDARVTGYTVEVFYP
jgi:predicted Zn finger-like uncharacterized protein